MNPKDFINVKLATIITICHFYKKKNYVIVTACMYELLDIITKH